MALQNTNFVPESLSLGTVPMSRLCGVLPKGGQSSVIGTQVARRGGAMANVLITSFFKKATFEDLRRQSERSNADWEAQKKLIAEKEARAEEKRLAVEKAKRSVGRPKKRPAPSEPLFLHPTGLADPDPDVVILESEVDNPSLRRRQTRLPDVQSCWQLEPSPACRTPGSNSGPPGGRLARRPAARLAASRRATVSRFKF